MVIDFNKGNGGSGSSYVLSAATADRLGGIMVGSGLSITTAGTLSADAQPVGVATTATTGVVQVGSGLSITSGGVLSTDINLSDYAEKSDLQDYATIESLSGYVETSAMSGYQTTDAMSGYQTTQAMSAYQTTEGMSGYVQTSAMSGYVETSDLEEYIPQYAMALKTVGDDNYKVINYSGSLYSVDKENYDETDAYVNIVKDLYATDISFGISGQTEIGLVEISSNEGIYVYIGLDENGDLYYTDGNVTNYYENDGIYDVNGFEFNWNNGGEHIDYEQRAMYIETSPLTSNFEIWRCVGQETSIANEDNFGLVRIGDGINLANDGTISVDVSDMRYVNSNHPIISGVYIKKDCDAAYCFDGAKYSFAIKYDQMFQIQEGESVELANGGNFVDFRTRYDYVDDDIILEYASSVDGFEEWNGAFDGDSIEIVFGDGGMKAPVSTTFNGDVSIDYELGVIKVSFNADDGWAVDTAGSFVSEWTKIADKDGNPLPKSFNGMLYNEEGKLQKGDYYLVTNNGNEQITVDPPYSDIFGIEIDNIYLDADATILKTDYNKEENNPKKGTRALPPYVRIYRDMDNNLVFEVFNGQDTTEYTYDYEDGMSVGIDMDGYSLINGEQQDEIFEGGGMTFSDTTLFRENEDANAKFVNFCIKQYDEDNDEYYDLWYNIYLKYKENGMSCVLATENYDSIISNYSSDAELHFELFSNEEYRISKLEKAIEELQNSGGGGDEL